MRERPKKPWTGEHDSQEPVTLGCLGEYFDFGSVSSARVRLRACQPKSERVRA